MVSSQNNTRVFHGPLAGEMYPTGEAEGWGFAEAVELDGKPLSYNRKEEILNPWFIVIGAADRDWLALLPDGE